MRKENKIAQVYTEDGIVKVKLQRGQNQPVHIVREATDLELITARFTEAMDHAPILTHNAANFSNTNSTLNNQIPMNMNDLPSQPSSQPNAHQHTNTTTLPSHTPPSEPTAAAAANGIGVTPQHNIQQQQQSTVHQPFVFGKRRHNNNMINSNSSINNSNINSTNTYNLNSTHTANHPFHRSISITLQRATAPQQSKVPKYTCKRQLQCSHRLKHIFSSFRSKI